VLYIFFKATFPGNPSKFWTDNRVR